MYRPKDGHQNMPNRHCILLHYPVGARVRQSRRHLQRAVALPSRCGARQRSDAPPMRCASKINSWPNPVPDWRASSKSRYQLVSAFESKQPPFSAPSVYTVFNGRGATLTKKPGLLFLLFFYSPDSFFVFKLSIFLINQSLPSFIYS